MSGSLDISSTSQGNRVRQLAGWPSRVRVAIAVQLRTVSDKSASCSGTDIVNDVSTRWIQIVDLWFVGHGLALSRSKLRGSRDRRAFE